MQMRLSLALVLLANSDSDLVNYQIETWSYLHCVVVHPLCIVVRLV